MQLRPKTRIIFVFMFCMSILVYLAAVSPSGRLKIDKKDRDPILLIIAVPSVEHHFEERDRIRQLTKQYPQVLCPFCTNKRDEVSQVQLIFFIGTNPNTKHFQYLPQIKQEATQYQDLVLLDMTENMNEGKTWEMFNWIYLNRKAEFVMKSDEDSFVHIPSLIQHLRKFQQAYPREYGSLYYGFPWIYDNEPLTSKSAVMIGMGYTLGWDLIEYIATDPNVRNNVVGYEDGVTRQWLENRTDVLRIGDRMRFHDPPGLSGPVSWSYQCNDVVIHRLKTDKLWNEIREFYVNCCDPIFDEPRKCRRSPKSRTCCGADNSICDRACITALRPVEIVEPFTNYFSDEDLDHQTPSSIKTTPVL